MRVVYLASGAAGMYCGSCMRDNRLAATLIAQGRDVVLLPLYTPLRTDEIDVSTGRIYYGGLNVYLQNKLSVFRRTPRFVDGLLDSPVLLRGIGRFAANTAPQMLGELTVAVLQGECGRLRKELEKLVSGLRELEPSLINLPNLMFLGIAHRLGSALAVPVVCTLAGEDVFLDALPEPYRTDALQLIREGVRHVDAFIAPTRYYARHATDHFGLDPDRVHVVPLGIGVDEFPEPEPPTDGAFSIGYLARICPEKGLANLCQALVRLRDAGRNCRVRAAGYLGRGDKEYLAHIVAFLKDRGEADAFEYVGEVSRAEKLAFLRSQHVVSVPSVYHESKGLYVLEAMAAGVPVVQPRIGAFPELVERTGGGLLYEPDDERGLADGIARLMDDPVLRESLGQAGRAGVQESFTADIMARETWTLYEQLCSAHSSSGTRFNKKRGQPMLSVQGLCKDYRTGSATITVLRDVDLTVKVNQAAVVMGPSGSGKSTLLNILGTLEVPTAGRFTIDGADLRDLSEPELARFRNRRIGLIFQDHHLLPQCSALENVLLPTLVDRAGGSRVERAMGLLERVGLSDRLHHLPSELSGGERQRVAIARALVNEPALVLADEPTGNLDRASAQVVADLLVELHSEQNAALVLVTHNDALAQRFDARYELLDGRLVPAQR